MANESAQLVTLEYAGPSARPGVAPLGRHVLAGIVDNGVILAGLAGLLTLFSQTEMLVIILCGLLAPVALYNEVRRRSFGCRLMGIGLRTFEGTEPLPWKRFIRTIWAVPAATIGVSFYVAAVAQGFDWWIWGNNHDERMLVVIRLVLFGGALLDLLFVIVSKQRLTDRLLGVYMADLRASAKFAATSPGSDQVTPADSAILPPPP